MGAAVSDLRILFPDREIVFVQGRRVEIRPVRLRDFEVFGAAAADLIALLAEPTDAAVMAYASKTKNLKAIIGRATSLSVWRASRLPAVTVVELMVHVVRLNSGFFDQALIGLVTALDGQTPPSN